jgi:hypothetical protein
MAERKRSRSWSDDEPVAKRLKIGGAGEQFERKGEHRYPAKLVEFLKPLSRCQNDNHTMFSEWDFTHTHDRGHSGEPFFRSSPHDDELSACFVA